MTSDLRRDCLLRLQDVTYSRGERRLLARANLSVYSGDMVWLRGQNGQGKTSLLKLAMKLLQPEAGHVRWGESQAHQQTPAFVGHHNGLKEDLTVQQALGFAARLQGWLPDPLALRMAMEHLSLYALRHTALGLLSQGERRRVALARLLLNRNALWILDEPLDALDGHGIQTVLDMLEAHARAGGAVLMTSHIPVPPGHFQTMDLMALQAP